MNQYDALLSALKALSKRGPIKTSELGWEVFGTVERPGLRRGDGSHCQNKFCRVIGKVIKRAERAGMITMDMEASKHACFWRITTKGKEFLK